MDNIIDSWVPFLPLIAVNLAVSIIVLGIFLYLIFKKLPPFLLQTGFPFLIRQMQENPRIVLRCVQFLLVYLFLLYIYT